MSEAPATPRACGGNCEACAAAARLAREARLARAPALPGVVPADGPQGPAAPELGVPPPATPAVPAEPPPAQRKRWPAKTILEVFPIFMALSTLLTIGTSRAVANEELLTPLSRVLERLPWWAVILMGGCLMVGLIGIGLATWMFSRAPVGSDDE